MEGVLELRELRQRFPLGAPFQLHLGLTDDTAGGDPLPNSLGADGAGVVEKVALPPGSLRQFIIEPAAAYVAESLTPFVAGWAVQSAEAAAFSIGVPMASG